MIMNLYLGETYVDQSYISSQSLFDKRVDSPDEYNQKWVILNIFCLIQLLVKIPCIFLGIFRNLMLFWKRYKKET